MSLRRQLADNQTLIRETVDRLRQSQEENEMNARRRDELEARITGLETEYEELLGKVVSFHMQNVPLTGPIDTTEKTIHDEDVSNVDVVESMAELKVLRSRSVICPTSLMRNLLH